MGGLGVSSYGCYKLISFLQVTSAKASEDFYNNLDAEDKKLSLYKVRSDPASPISMSVQYKDTSRRASPAIVMYRRACR